MSVEGFFDDDEEWRGNWVFLLDIFLDGKSFGCLVVEIYGYFCFGECDYYYLDEYFQEIYFGDVYLNDNDYIY